MLAPHIRMGCCPSSSLDASLPLPSTPSQPNTPDTHSPFPYNQIPTDCPPPYSPHPPVGHKSLSISSAASDTQIPVRGWGEQFPFPSPIAAWGPSENNNNNNNNNNAPNIEYRDQQQLQNQVQLLQHFINIIQQESVATLPTELRSSVEDVESYVTLHPGPSEQADRLPPLTGATRRVGHSVHSPDTLIPIRPISFPPYTAFPPALAPCNSNDLNLSNPLSRLPPLQLDNAGQERTEGGAAPENQSPHSQRSGTRRRRKKRRRRRATVTPADTSPHSPLPTLQRPFTSPNLTATLASPLGPDHTFT